MPRIKTGSDASAANVEPGDTTVGYDGPVPPKGIYHCNVKRLRLKKNKNGDYMFNGVAEIAEPESSDKAQYNGYGIWFNQNIAKNSASFTNSFIDALAGGRDMAVRKAVWDSAGRGVMVEDDENMTVKAIDKLKIKEEMPVIVQARESSYDGKPKLDAGAFLVAVGKDEDEDNEDEDDEDEDERPPF